MVYTYEKAPKRRIITSTVTTPTYGIWLRKLCGAWGPCLVPKLHFILFLILLWTYFIYYLLLFTVPNICTHKDSKRSLNFCTQENKQSEENLNSSTELNGIVPLSQTSVVSFNLDDNIENEVHMLFDLGPFLQCLVKCMLELTNKILPVCLYILYRKL